MKIKSIQNYNKNAWSKGHSPPTPVRNPFLQHRNSLALKVSSICSHKKHKATDYAYTLVSITLDTQCCALLPHTPHMQSITKLKAKLLTWTVVVSVTIVIAWAITRRTQTIWRSIFFSNQQPRLKMILCNAYKVPSTSFPHINCARAAIELWMIFTSVMCLECCE